MNVRIVIDSTTDTVPEVSRRCTIVPLTVHFGDKTYIDGVTITKREFYEKLIEGDVIPTTSQPAPEAFSRVFREAADACDEVVVLTVSSRLSGTYQSACIAAEEYRELVHVVDGKNVAIGTGILAELALQLKERGMCAAEIAAELEQARENVHLIALLDTLEYLKRGGRISKASAIAGGILSIKPVVCIRDGEISVLGKARGSRQGNNLLVREIEHAGGVDFEKSILLGYTGLSDILLQKYIEDSAYLWAERADTLPAAIVGSVVGTHAGPGAVAVAFFQKN